MSQQIGLKILNLREEFFRVPEESDAVFARYLRTLIVTVDSDWFRQHLFTDFFGKGDLKGLARAVHTRSHTDANTRILVLAADACVMAFEKALVEKRRLAKAGQFPLPPSRGNGLIQCPHCRSKIYNQDQHNQLFHPGLRATRERPKKTKPENKSLPLTPAPPVLKPKVQHRVTHGERPSPPVVHPNGSARDRADTGPAERKMDALRTLGGRYRDFNGTFGSYPLHDGMDDESNAG